LQFQTGQRTKVRLKPRTFFLIAVTLAIAAGRTAAQPITASRIFTFTNPVSTNECRFGVPAVPMDSARVIIGAAYPDSGGGTNQMGEAYLFNTNGTLLATFTNPAAAFQDYFGSAIAPVGGNKVAVGARYNPGAAYLFSTNGTLITTFTNPTPYQNYDSFGNAVAAVGADKVLICANGASIGASFAGAAYLFSVNGTLITTFTNPEPSWLDGFGDAVAVVDEARIFITAHYDNMGEGRGYLFSTNGVLITTFTNPAPKVFRFGFSAALVGSDKIIVGAVHAASQGMPSGPGAAYLFNTNGALITTIPNPHPTHGAFGVSVAGITADKVLIGAHSDGFWGFLSGIAYMFSTNGTLLMTFTNPPPSAGDGFGGSVAALSEDTIIIGATGAPNLGAAYLYRLNAPFVPRLRIASLPGGNVRVGWPSASIGWVLESTAALGSAQTNQWNQVPSILYETNAVEIFLTTNPANHPRFYRLIRP
jgi:hypothetical protein